MRNLYRTEVRKEQTAHPPEAQRLLMEDQLPEPMRAAYMRGRVVGVVPMEGRDIYQDGRGQILIRLARVFTVGDDTGPEMDQVGAGQGRIAAIRFNVHE